MKKMLSAILMITVLFSATIFVMPFRVANAENEVVLPNGLQFGMSLSEAAAISGFKKGDRSERHDAEMTMIGFDCDYLIGNATIGGHEASMEIFFENNFLRQIEYELVGVSGLGYNKEVEESWVSVGKALKEKYGQSQAPAHQFANTGVDYSFGSGKGKRNEFRFTTNQEEFVINVSDGSVYIDNYISSIINRADTDPRDVYSYKRHYLLYTFYDFQVDSNIKSTNSVGF